MKKIFKNSIRIFAMLFVAGFLFSLNINNAEAAVRTWTGTTSGAWSVAGNWSGSIAPVTGDDLVFPNGASNLSNSNDLTESTIFNSITFSGSGYTLSGNTIILGPGVAGITDSVASGGNTIALDVRLDVTRDIIVTNTAETLTISGRITGVGGINKEGTGKVILSGANTFGGVLKINVGVVNAQNDRALGTNGATTNGTEVVGGAALELQGTINIGYETLALRGYGVSGGGALRNISDNNTFGGLITLSSAGGTEISSDSGILTVTGGMSGAFPLVIDGAGNVTYSTTPVGVGTGTVTKNGAGTLKYNFPNTYTGLTTINAGTLLYGVDNAILSGAITVNGGTLDIATYSDMVGAVTLGTTDLASGTITGSSGILSATGWTVNAGTISAIIAGDGAVLTKNTTGTVTLTRPNQYTGNTSVALGILKIQDSLALGLIDGTTSITSGATLQIDGSGLSIPEYITFSGTGHLYTGAIRNMTGDNTITGLLTVGNTTSMIESDSSTTLTIDTKGMSAAALGLIIGGAGNVTFTETAPIYGTTATLTKNDTGVLTIEGFSNFTGATNLSRGEIVLSSAGAIPLSTVTIGSGGTLTLDNTDTTILNRISDTAAFTMNGGNFNFIGNTTGTAYETAGALTLSTGYNVITTTPGAGGSTTMTFASFARTSGATALFRGTSLGSPPAANVSTIMFATAPTSPALAGAAGAANTTTASILKGAFGDNSLSGTGTDMVTYNLGNTNGLRLLNGAGFSGEYSTTLTTNTNVKLAADVAASTVSINSLILNGFGITNPGGASTITISNGGSLAGNILINSATNIAGVNTTLGITTNELNILTTANSTISATIGTATTGLLTLSGSGNVTMSAANAYTGATSINGATLTYGASNILSSGNVIVTGGTYDLNGNSDTVGSVTLQNGTISSGAGVLSGTSYSFREGTVSATLAGGAATVTVIATGTAADAVVTMSGNNTYTGVTTITSGILKLGAGGDGTNTPLGTTGTGTTIANGGALDLNGTTFSTAEAITSLAGTGFGPSGSSNMGAIMDTHTLSSATYSGALTLTAAARINADAEDMTISSNISGNFALTFGGFSDITYSGVRSGTSTIVKDGINTLTLSNGNSSYTGATTISSGTVKIGAASVGGTNSPLGTTGGATTVALGSRLDLNGINLGIAEPLTINGVGYSLGDFASGALMNSSGTAATFSGAVTLGSASTIKANSGDITLSGGLLGANALTIGGTGNTIISGAITTVTTVTKIDTGITTLSSASSSYAGLTTINLGTIKLGVSAGATNTPLGTNAAGTTVYSGAVLDLNGFAMTTTEAIIINGRGINDGGALVGSATGTLGGTVAQSTDSRITNTSGTLTITGAVTGAFTLMVGGAGNVTTSAVFANSALAITKQGAGTLTVTGANLYTGETRVEAGTFAYAASTTLAVTNLMMKGGIFNNGANADTIGTVTLVDGTITNSVALTGTAYTLESGTISGILAGNVAVVKNTNNNVILSGVNTISNTATINAGTLTLSGSGTAVSVTGVTVNLGGTLTLDNSSTNSTDRLGAITVTMNGGNFNYKGSSSTNASETIAQLAYASGHNIVTVTPGGGGSTQLTMSNATCLNRSAGATVLYRGTSFGSAAAANVSTLLCTTPPTTTFMPGAAGGSGTTTISVLKGSFGDGSLTGTGTDMVTYNVGNTNGLRLLNGAGFSGEYAANFGTNNANVKITGNTAAATQNVNSLIINGGDVTNPGSAQTLTISNGTALAGNILIASANNIAGANTTFGITTNELAVLAAANTTITAVTGTAVAGLLTISGSGTVTLSTAAAYTGTTTINNGTTLTEGASNVLSTGGVTIVGGTFDLNGNSDSVGAITMTAGTAKSGAGTLTTTGTVATVANANSSSLITGTLAVPAAAVFNIADGLFDNDAVISATVTGAGTSLTKSTGAGVVVLSGSNTYAGSTTISAGTVRLGAAGGGTNTPLGTTAGITTVGSGFSLDLNGYTLGTSEALTISGTGIGGFGALLNTSSTAVTYSGLITLGAAATITANYGTITLSNTGSMTGTGFALTLRGAGNGILKTQVNTSTAGSLVKNDAGIWEIWGDSNYTGVTTVTLGLLKLGAAGGVTNTSLGTVGGATTVASGAMLDLNGFTLGTAEPITINGTGIANTGAFINSSNNSISYSGAITLGATVRVANYGSGVLTLTGAISGNNALTLVTVGGITQSSASVWSGSGTLTKEGSGTLILQGQNTMTGAMTVSTGVLQLGASGTGVSTSGPFGTIAGGITVSAGAVLDLSTFTANGASTWEPLALSGSGLFNGGALISNSSSGSTFATVSNTTNARIINNGVGTLTFAGAFTSGSNTPVFIGGSGPTTISGAINTATLLLTKIDAGILTLSSASNINTSLVRIDGGTLAYGVADALSTPAVTIAGGTLDLKGFNETNIGAITLIDGSIVNTGGAATLTSTVVYTLENGTISAVLGGAVAAGIAKNTAGRVTLSGNNTFTSTSIALNAGYLNLQNSNALGASGTSLTTTISGGATLELQNTITLPSTKAITANGTGVNNTGAIRNVADSNAIQANITLGTTNVRINSDSGTLTFPTISGNTFNTIFGGAGNTAVTGIISTTSGNLTKDGAGTLTLSGANTYTRPTTILGGTLVANATAALGDSSSTNTLIFNGGTLQSSGAITSVSTRAVTLAYGGGTIDTTGGAISIAGTVGSVGGLTKTGSGTLTITGVTTIGGDLTISNGTFVAPTSLTINGGFSNSGTFTHSNGTVTLVPTSSTLTTNILGSSDTTFYNLTDTTAGSTLQFKAGNTYTFANTLTLTGIEGNPIAINSDTPNSQWLMTLSGSSSISYLKVKDSGCNGGNNVGASGTIYNYGNNGACWFFTVVTHGGGGGFIEGSGALGTVVLTGDVVTSVTITNGGGGYTTPPVVNFCGAVGSGATGTAVLTNGVVTSVTIGAGGSGYNSSSVGVVFGSDCPTSGGDGGGSGGSSEATGTVVVSANVVVSVTINSGGSGYTSVPTVLFCGGGGSGATGTAVLTGDAVSGVTVNSGGSNYTTVPTIVFNSNCPTGGGGGGGDDGGDIGFLYERNKTFIFLKPFDLNSFKKYA